jgi:hypothetical protein
MRRILTPPRDGSSLHPDVIKDAFVELGHEFRVQTIVMDMERAADIAAWLEDELGVTVIDRGQTNKLACADFEAFMDGLRNGTLKHTGDAGLRSHVLHAIARRLPGGDHRFDRPVASRRSVGAQDRRVIDALTAAGMVVSIPIGRRKPVRCTRTGSRKHEKPLPPQQGNDVAPAVLEAIRDGSFQPYPLLGGGARQRIQEAFTFAHRASLPWIYQNTPAVRTVIDTLTRNISQLDLRLYEEIDEANREPKPDHPAAMSMRYPSETVPADQFIRQLFQDFFVFDDAFALMGFRRGTAACRSTGCPRRWCRSLGTGCSRRRGTGFGGRTARSWISRRNRCCIGMARTRLTRGWGSRSWIRCGR